MRSDPHLGKGVPPPLLPPLLKTIWSETGVPQTRSFNKPGNSSEKQVLSPLRPTCSKTLGGHHLDDDALLGMLVTLKFENQGFNPMSLTLAAIRIAQGTST